MARGSLTKVGRVVFGVVLLALVFAGGASPSSPPPPAADEATAYQLDATHDGSIADAGLTAPLSQTWSISMPGASYPLIVDGMVFVTSSSTNTLYALNQATGATIWSHPLSAIGRLTYDRGRVFMMAKGLLTAFDAGTGATAWSQQVFNQYAILAPPTAANGIVYVHGASSGAAIVAVRESSGQILWAQSIGSYGFASPAATAQGVYLSVGSQEALAFDPLSGALLWHTPQASTGSPDITPVVASGHVLMRDTHGNLVVDALTGAVQGSFPGSSAWDAPYSTPAVANDVAYIVSGEAPNTVLTAIAGSGLGSTNWTFSGDGKISTGLIVVDGLVFFGSGNNTLYALDATTGATTWSTSVGAEPTNVAAANGTLVVSAGDNLVAYANSGASANAPANQSPPSISGATDLHEIQAADVGVWSGLPSAYTYQWQRCDTAGANCADIAGATNLSYITSAADYDSTLRVAVAATNGAGTSDPVESAPTAVLGLATAPPALSAPPVLYGSPTVGQSLSTTNGTWTNSPTIFAYQWQRCDDAGSNCVDISGATSSQYTPVTDDVGSTIRSEVLASNNIGPAPNGYAPSAPTSNVVPAGKAAPADQATAYQLDATHDGSIPAPGLTAPLAQAWSVNLPGAPGYSLIADGMVFTVADHKVYALNQATGATIWVHPLGGDGSLTYDRGRVFTVNNHGLLTARDAATGAIAWNEQLPGEYSFVSAPTAANGIVYVEGEGDAETLYAVRETDGKLLWKQYGDIGNGSPAVTARGVYFSAYDFDPVLGTQLWHQTSGSPGLAATPVVASGYVFFGNLLLSPTTGAVQGTFAAGDFVPAVAKGVAYVLNGSTLSAVDGVGLGSTDWTFAGDGALDTAPIVAGGLVFEGSSNGNLYALDPATGATSWSTDVSSSIETAHPVTNLAAANGTLVVSAGTNLVAYRTAGAITDAPSNQSPPTVAGSDDLNEVKAADVGVWSGLPSSYAYQWELCDSAGANCADIDGATDSSYVPGPEAYGQTLRVTVVATNGVGSSDPVESAATDVLGLATAVPVFSTAPAVSGTAVVGQQLSTTNGTWTNSATTYAYQWQRCDDTGANCVDIAGATSSQYTPVTDDIGSELRSEVLASNAIGPASSGYAPSDTTRVVVDVGAPSILTSPADEASAYQLDATHDGYLASAGLSAPLAHAWSVNLGGDVSHPLIAQGMVFVTALNKLSGGTKAVETLTALNQATGSILWSEPTGTRSQPTALGLTYDRGRVFVADDSGGGLTAFDAATGAVAWNTTLAFESFQSPPTASNGIVYTSTGANLYAISESDGAVLWKQPVIGGANSAPAVTAQGVYVSYDGQQVYDFDPQLGTVLWHYSACPTCEGGGGQTPVVADGHVFVTGSSGSLIFSASTGVVQGSFNGSPAVANGVAFMGDDSELNVIDADGFGNLLWSFAGDGHLATSPIVAGGIVFEGSGGHLYALNAATGATLWSTTTGGSSDLVASNGTLLSVSANTGPPGATTLTAYRNAGTITDPPSNQSSPSVEGPADLSGLEAADVGVWSGVPSAYSYQWERCDGAGANCANIAGATGATYLPPANLVGVGATLRVRVVATNGVGSSAPAESAPSASAPLVVVASHSLRRQGSVGRRTAGVGEQLSTTNGIWTNHPTSYAYKWQRCDAKGRHCVDIAGATDPTYTSVAADKGHEIRSAVRARNASGPAATYVPSAPTSPLGLPWPGLLRSPIVSGTAATGKQLVTDTGAWTNTPTSYAYRWQRCTSTGSNCVNIMNATNSHYRLVLADAGHEIRSEVRASNAAGPAQTGYAPSAPTRVVVRKPVVVTLPKISGTAKVRHSLAATSGTWGYSPTSFAYQWFRCNALGTSCTKIIGAKSSSYRLASADAGHKLVVNVTATNAAGSAIATSKPSAKILH